MSFDGMVRNKGSRVQVARMKRIQATDLSFSEKPVKVSTFRLVIQPLTAEIAQRLWGQESKAVFSGATHLGADVKMGDLIKVTEGAFKGDFFRVVEWLPYSLTGTKHLELGLELAKDETF